VVGGIALRIKPELRFSTRQHIDGLGYLQQPFSVVVNITLITALSLIITLFKR